MQKTVCHFNMGISSCDLRIEEIIPKGLGLGLLESDHELERRSAVGLRLRQFVLPDVGQ